MGAAIGAVMGCGRLDRSRGAQAQAEGQAGCRGRPAAKAQRAPPLGAALGAAHGRKLCRRRLPCVAGRAGAASCLPPSCRRAHQPLPLTHSHSLESFPTPARSRTDPYRLPPAPGPPLPPCPPGAAARRRAPSHRVGRHPQWLARGGGRQRRRSRPGDAARHAGVADGAKARREELQGGRCAHAAEALPAGLLPCWPMRLRKAGTPVGAICPHTLQRVGAHARPRVRSCVRACVSVNARAHTQMAYCAVRGARRWQLLLRRRPVT
jgi:hypothetical protein